MTRFSITVTSALAFSLLSLTSVCHAQSDLSDSEVVWSRVSDLVETELSTSSRECVGNSDADQKADDFQCVESCCPRWITRVNAIFMQRSRPDSLVLIASPVTPAPNLNADNFDFGFQPGIDASIIRQLSCNRAIEFRYFDLFESDAAQAVAIPGNPIMNIGTNPPIPVIGNRNVGATYDSELRTLEINGRVKPRDWFTLMAGFRYVRLDEHFHADLVDPNGANATVRYDTVTSNDLYGAQLGGEAIVWNNCDRAHIEVIGKAGIYGNDASQRTVLSNGVFTAPANGGSGRVAFLGEVGVTGAYRLTDCWSIRGGYQLMWITGVALATDQVPATNILTQSGFDGSGGVFYHGAFVGLEWTLP